MTPPCPHDDHPDGYPSCASSVDLLRIQQASLTIVCAWCQQTMRWQRAEGAARGQMSHSICFDCFADVFGELDGINPLFPFSKKM